MVNSQAQILVLGNYSCVILRSPYFTGLWFPYPQGQDNYIYLVGLS